MLRERRKELGLTQVELAQACKCSPRFIGELKRRVAGGNIKRSASQHLACDKIQELYDEKRKKEPEGAGRPAGDLAEAARKMILVSLELAEKVDAA